MSFTPPTGVLGELCAIAEDRVRASRHQVLPTPIARPAFGLRTALEARGRFPLLCEVKRASPSAGVLRETLSAGDQASTYARAGAAALSVLTEPTRFLGSLADVDEVRAVVDIPILRKDFIVDPRMVDEAHAYGADAVLLIAAAIPPERLLACAARADALGLDCLLELAFPRDLDVLTLRDWPLVGINARDLETLAMNAARFAELALAASAPGRLLIAESGIKDLDGVLRARADGAHAALIGEALMRSAEPDLLIQAWSAA